LRWYEEPVSAWRQDRTIALFILLHSIGVIVLGVLFLLHIIQFTEAHTLFLLDAAPFMSDGERSEFYQALSMLATCGLGMVWFFCSSLLAFTLARRWVRPIHLGITPNGVVSGPYLVEWAYFSHFSVDSFLHLIRFYSSRTPDLACMAWRPPDVDVFNQAVNLLGQRLPTSPSRPMVSWYRRHSVLIGLLLLAITIPFVSVGFLVYSFAWGWLYYTWVMPLMVILGSIAFRQV